MSFVVETGQGLADANSYVTVADADLYVGDHDGSTAWTAASETDKQKALRLGTQYVDLHYGPRYRGKKAAADQGLSWPRSSVIDGNGFAYTSDQIPICLQQATVEAALRVIDGDDLLGVLDSPGAVKREKAKVGPLEEEIEYVGGKAPQPVYPKIKALLWPILDSADCMERG